MENNMSELSKIVLQAIMSNMDYNDLYIELNLDRLIKEDGVVNNVNDWSDDIRFGLCGDGHNYEMILHEFLLMLQKGQLKLVKTDKFDDKRMEYIKDLYNNVKNKYV